jgi:hypothetical protein
MKLKNVHTGEVRDVVSLSDDHGLVTGLTFSRERGAWETLVVQKWDAVSGDSDVFWVPAKPGVDY